MNNAPVPITQTPQAQTQATLNNTNNGVPRYWESAADGKRVYDYMLQQEGNFAPKIQRPEFYRQSALNAIPNLIQNYYNLKPLKVIVLFLIAGTAFYYLDYYVNMDKNTKLIQECIAEGNSEVSCKSRVY